MSNPTEAKFGDPANRIAQTSHWTVLLRPKQPTLGALALVCREPVKSFGELSPGAYADLRGVVRRIESALRDVTAYERINYLMLMMVDPDVHFHVVPRYDGVREFEGQSYRDAGWPGPPQLEPSITPEGPARDALIVRLRAAWNRAEG